MTDVIGDLVILGRAVPERLSDGRKTVCLGGWSPTRGFIRIYPTRLRLPIGRWDILRIEVERNDRDTRDESWKIIGSRDDWGQLGTHIQKVGKVTDPFERREIVTTSSSSCVNLINSEKRSLGIIRPKIERTHFERNPQYMRNKQPLLFDIDEEDWATIKEDFEFEPRIQYCCDGCIAQKGHDQKILEWGFYEWIRKNPGNMEQVWENAKLLSPSHDIFFFVGNLARYRSRFLIISVLPITKQEKEVWIQGRLKL